MDYIKQINAFWEKLTTDMNLKTSSGFVYMALLQINNRTGWKSNFKAVRSDIMLMANIANVKTYYTCLNELVNGGYITYKPGPNQYVSAEFRIEILYNASPVAKPKNGTAYGEAHGTATGEPTGTATGTIHKHINNKTNKPINNIERGTVAQTKFSPPPINDLKTFFIDKIPESNWSLETCEVEANKFFNFYESKNWYVGKNKMVKWKSAASGWISRTNQFNNGKAKSTKQTISEKQESRNELGNLANNVLTAIAAKHSS